MSVALAILIGVAGFLLGAVFMLGLMMWATDAVPQSVQKSWTDMAPEDRIALAHTILAHEELRKEREHG